jgi:tryprostatin B 6-hydroxylase
MLLGAAALGPLTHYAIWVRFEVDYLPWLPMFALLQIVLPLALHYLGLSFLEAAVSSFILQTVYITTTFASIALYRLAFHPLRKFPGPFWARLSCFWRVKVFTEEGDRAYLVLDKLHKKYGDVVRVG